MTYKEWVRVSVAALESQRADSVNVNKFNWHSIFDKTRAFVEKKAPIYRSQFLSSICNVVASDSLVDFFAIEYYWHSRKYGRDYYAIIPDHVSLRYDFDSPTGRLSIQKVKLYFDYKTILKQFNELGTTFSDEKRNIEDLLVVTHFMNQKMEVKVILLPTQDQIRLLTATEVK